MNKGNYGLLVEIDPKRAEGAIKYSIKFVDHLPNANNGIFSSYRDNPEHRKNDIENYSPRGHLNFLSEGIHSMLCDSAYLNTSKQKFIREKLAEGVHHRLNDLVNAIDAASEDVKKLTDKYGANFIPAADKERTTYLEKIRENHKFYEERLTYEAQSKGRGQQHLIQQ